jgi:hypothetical protein
MTLEKAVKTSEVPGGEDLARLWSEAPALLPQGGGCACVGHVNLHLDAVAVEADILDYLATRYLTKDSELADFVAARTRSRGVTFAVWLASLDTAPLSLGAAARLRSDLHATLASLADARHGSH